MRSSGWTAKTKEGTVFESIGQDVRLALRAFRRAPGFTAVAVATIAIAIGAATTTFSVINGALLRPLPYGEPDRLVAIFQTENNGPRVAAASTESRNPASPANFADWQRQADFIEDMTAAHPWSPVMTGTETPNRLSGLKATPSLFELLRVPAHLGRTFGPADAVNPNVIVLGHGMWESVFGARRDILGTTVSLDGVAFEIIGVMPPSFQFPPFWAVDADMWVPLVFDPETATARRAAFLRVFGRLRDGTTVEAAQFGMDAIAAALETQYQWANAGIGVNVESLREPGVSGVRPAVSILAGTVGLLLLIACSNVANLLLSRASARQGEVAVRFALGASRARVIRQWFTESLMLGLAGGGLGAFMAWVSIGPVSALVRDLLPVTAVIAIDLSVLLFAVGISVVSAVIFGTLPALQASSAALGDALRTSRIVGRGRRPRVALITVEVALAIVMLVGAGLFTRTLVELVNHDPGFRTRDVLALDLAFGASSRAEYVPRLAQYEMLLQEVRAVPGVRAAGLVNHVPVGSDIWRTRFNRPEVPPEAGEGPLAVMRVAGQGFDRAIGLEVRQGRWFDGTETRESERVVVVNETLARSTWPSGDAIGRRIRLGADEDSPVATVIGVYADASQMALRREVSPEVYYPLSQDPTEWNTDVTLVLSASAATPGLVAAVRDRVWRVDAAVPITNVRTVERILAAQVNRERTSMLLMITLAGAALVLCAIGVYGVINYLATLRNREIGVRVALGADPARILGMVTRDGVMMAVPGIVLGVGAALLLGRLARSMLWQVQPHDPLTITAVVGLLAIVAALATLVPAVRASRTDPASVLREQ
jgi:predicted permease